MHLKLENLPRTIAVEVEEGVPQVVMVDQRMLPGALEHIRTSDWRTLIDCVKNLAVRGAPAIGIAGAAVVMLRAFEFVAANAEAPADIAACETPSDDVYACLMCQRRKVPAEGEADAQSAAECLECREEDAASAPAADEAAREALCNAMDAHRTFVLDERAFDPELLAMALEFSAQMAKNARPTAVNLAWGADRAIAAAREALAAGEGAESVARGLLSLVQVMVEEDESVNRRIGEHGAAVLRELGRNLVILTHCNAGSLATAFYGTALGVVYAAAQEGLIERVYADETRPVNQGARLTVWELARAGVPVTLQCDDMAASLLQSGQVDAAIVGADRVAANGDVANKIGTLGLAIMARYFNVPFYVAAPTSTIDCTTKSGSAIPIEERAAVEVLPEPIDGVAVRNPAFDVTPYELVTAIITEDGIWKPTVL